VWLWASVACALALGSLYWLLRAQTHFLGDGYLLLDQLASGQPVLRWQNYGETVLHRIFAEAWPGPSLQAAFASYRVLSVAAGFLHSALVIAVAILLFGRTARSFLFAAGMMTGGWALLHFAYVENYAYFGLCVAAFCYFGLLESEGRLGVTWALLAAAFAVFMHGLGLCLLPAAVLVALRDSRTWDGITARPLRLLLWLSCVAALSALTVKLVLDHSWFLRLAIVPFASSPICVEGYSLGSRPHLLDVFNLLVMLVPSLGVLLVLQFEPGLDRSAAHRASVFLSLLGLSCLACAVVFEAKLGMPRDWDLFSFVGLPLQCLLLYRVLRGSASRWCLAGLAVAVVINAAALIDRAYIQNVPELGIRLFRQYADLDVLKNRHGWYLLERYYQAQDDRDARDAVHDLRRKVYPGEETLQRAWLSYKEGRLDESRALTREALDTDPLNPDAWLNLGRILSASRQPESAVAVLAMADGMRPHSPPVLVELGLAYFDAGDLVRAEEAMLSAHRADTSQLEPLLSLARIAEARGAPEQYAYWLTRAAFRPDADGAWARELGDFYLKQHDAERAARAYEHALGLGRDSAAIRDTLRRHPEVARYLPH
jgi:tetratricopeptide (TPR) repeat protein